MNTRPVVPADPNAAADPIPRGWFQRAALSHPILLLVGLALPFVWVTQLGSAVAGIDLMPAKLAELLVLVGLAAAISRATDPHGGIRQLFAGLLRWRLGWRYVLLVVAMPLLTVGVGLLTGTLQSPADGWAPVVLTYLMFLVIGAVTANLWEETVWGGFVQGRLMARHGLLVGSLLTAIPFFVIHLPLAFESNGWAGTTWSDALITWGVLLVAAPFQRYLIGTLLVDTRGSTLAAGLMHASINAAGAMAVVPGGWQLVPALIVLTLGVGSRSAHRSRTDAMSAVVAGPVTPARPTHRPATSILLPPTVGRGVGRSRAARHTTAAARRGPLTIRWRRCRRSRRAPAAPHSASSRVLRTAVGSRRRPRRRWRV